VIDFFFPTFAYNQSRDLTSSNKILGGFSQQVSSPHEYSTHPIPSQTPPKPANQLKLPE
jgi:hypothetical protein